MFVTGSAGSFEAGATVNFMLGNAVSLVVFDSCGSGGTGNLASEVTVHSVVVAVHFMSGCLEYFAEFVFDGHCPCPPLYFYKWGNLVPILISLLLELWWHKGLPLLGVVALSLWGDLKWM